MKNFIIICFMLFIAKAESQTPITRIVALSDLNSSDPAATGDDLRKTTSGSNESVFFVISGVENENQIKDFKVFKGDKEKNENDGIKKEYVSASKEERIDISSIISQLDESATISLKKGGKIRYSFDCKYSADLSEEPTGCDEGNFQQRVQEEFKMRIYPQYKKDFGIESKHNLFLDKNNTVHIFVDQRGQYQGHALPTTATEKYTYQIHLITTSCLSNEYHYYFDYSGNYNPKLNIDKNGAKAQSAQADKILVIDFPVIGPFTEKFTFNVKKALKNTPLDKQTIVNAEVTVPKLYHVSITTGLVGTSLRDPKNIQIAPLNAQQNTLIADDPSSRGLITVMAVYYPKGRSFLFEPSGWAFDASRFGIVAGTQLGQDADENFFFGFSNDFARGGAITYGLHYGRRNVLPNNKHFDFGDSVYDLTDPISKKEWNIGFFIGISIDTRVAFELLKALNPTSQP